MFKLTPYQRIVRAARRGAGVRLSSREVFDMSKDTAIEQVALNDDDDQEREREVDAFVKAKAKEQA